MDRSERVQHPFHRLEGERRSRRLELHPLDAEEHEERRRRYLGPEPSLEELLAAQVGGVPGEHRRVRAQLAHLLRDVGVDPAPDARALDVVGDRWTLLIVRELVPGPRRFTDLVDGLPGISRPLLTERLRALERDGIIGRQELEPPAARQVYKLTEEGRDLAQAMVPLIAWGARRLGDRKPSESFRAHWGALAMASFADREAARGVSETYQYVVGRSAFHITVDDGAIRLRDGRALDPAVTVTTDEETWADIASGKITASAAADSGALTIEGDSRARKRLGKIVSRRQVFAQAEATLGDLRIDP